MNTPTNLTETLATLMASAVARCAPYPQYLGHFDGYKLARVKRTIVTKMGLAFEAGEIVIASPPAYLGVPGFRTITCWSVRNECDTVVKSWDVEWL